MAHHVDTESCPSVGDDNRESRVACPLGQRSLPAVELGSGPAVSLPVRSLLVRPCHGDAVTRCLGVRRSKHRNTGRKSWASVTDNKAFCNNKIRHETPLSSYSLDLLPPVLLSKPECAGWTQSLRCYSRGDRGLMHRVRIGSGFTVFVCGGCACACGVCVHVSPGVSRRGQDQPAGGGRLFLSPASQSQEMHHLELSVSPERCLWGAPSTFLVSFPCQGAESRALFSY